MSRYPERKEGLNMRDTRLENYLSIAAFVVCMVGGVIAGVYVWDLS